MKPIVVTTSPGFGKVGRVPEVIAASGWEFIRCIDTDLADGGMVDYIDRMEYLVVGLVPATAEVIAGAPRLRAVLKHGVGVDNIDIAAATARGIPVLNTPAANANAVAEFALGAMISLARHVPALHGDILAGTWRRRVGMELGGKTLGIVGLGNVGRLLAAKARCLGMKVLANDLVPNREFAAEHGVTLCELERVLGEADIVSVHIYGGRENTNFIGARQLAMMKPSAYLINYARGEVVDTGALADALEQEAIAGAALDAYVEEPPDFSQRIFSCPNVLFTPHSGADTVESVERMGLMVCEDIATLQGGGRPARVLNQDIYAYAESEA